MFTTRGDVLAKHNAQYIFLAQATRTKAWQGIKKKEVRAGHARAKAKGGASKGARHGRACKEARHGMAGKKQCREAWQAEGKAKSRSPHLQNLCSTLLQPVCKQNSEIDCKEKCKLCANKLPKSHLQTLHAESVRNIWKLAHQLLSTLGRKLRARHPTHLIQRISSTNNIPKQYYV